MAAILNWSGDVGHLNSACKRDSVGVKYFDDITCNKPVNNYNNSNNKLLTVPGWQGCIENHKDLHVDPELVVKLEPEEVSEDTVTRPLTEHYSDSLGTMTVHFQTGNDCAAERQSKNSSCCQHSVFLDTKRNSCLHAVRAVKTKPEKRNSASSFFSSVKLRAEAMRQDSDSDVSYITNGTDHINTASPQKTGPVPVKLFDSNTNSTLQGLNQGIPNDAEWSMPNDTEWSMPNDTEWSMPNVKEVHPVSLPASSAQVAPAKQSRRKSCKPQRRAMQKAKCADQCGGDLNLPASGPSGLSSEGTCDLISSSMFIYTPTKQGQDSHNLTREKQETVRQPDQQNLTAKQREAARQRQRRYIQNLTPERREAARQRERQRYQQYRQNLTPEEREAERQRYRKYRQNLTPEQRDKDRQRQQCRKQNMTPEQREAARQRQQCRKQNLTPEQKELARQRQRQFQQQYQQRRTQKLTPEQQEAARQHERQRQKRRTQNLTPEQREAARLRMQQYRQKLTQEKREAIQQSQTASDTKLDT